MITILGLGIGSLFDLNIKAQNCLRDAKKIVTTASWHPVWNDIKQTDILAWDSWEIAKRIQGIKAMANEDFCFAVAGDPFIDEPYLQQLCDELQNHHSVEIIRGLSRIHELPLPSRWQFFGQIPVKLENDLTLSEALIIRVHFGQWETFKESLPQDKNIYYENRFEKGQALVKNINILDGYIVLDNKKENQKPIDELLSVMRRLRAPDGCAWDKVQTFESLKPYVVEEAYELWDAIDSKDKYLLVEELGDVLLQVVFHTTIAEEEGLFNFDEVAREVSRKLISRHPHVFGDLQADTPEKVMVTWEAIKKDEKGKEDRLSILDGVPKHLPGLSKAMKIQKKAAKVGFDWIEIDDVWGKVHEEMQELKDAQDQNEKEEELGDLLFAIVNLSRFLKIDPEVALTKTINKFQNRFRYIEKHANRPLVEMTLEEMDVFWEAAKKEHKD